jgi:hypothetical protein
MPVIRPFAAAEGAAAAAPNLASAGSKPPPASAADCGGTRSAFGILERLLEVALTHCCSARDLAEFAQVLAGFRFVGCEGVQLNPFIGQERGIRCEYSILGAEGDELVDQLAILAVEVDLIDQVTQPADSPEALDKVIGRSLIGASHFRGKLKRPALAADLTSDPDRRPA